MDNVNLTDNQIIEKIIKEDKEVYSIIVERYQSRLYTYIFRLTNHREEATDILQEVFLKAYKSLRGFNRKKKFSSWIYRIAHNESVNWLKKNTKVKKQSIDDDENKIDIADGLNLTEQFENDDDKKELAEQMDKLPSNYKEVLVLRYMEERSYEEIGDIIKKSTNAVGILINRAKKQLAEIYENSQD